MTDVKQFITELRELMVKHDVTDIGADFEGDTQGIYDQRFFITVKDDKQHWGRDIKITGDMVLDTTSKLSLNDLK